MAEKEAHMLGKVGVADYYRIVGKFGRENVWQIYSFQVFGRKKFGCSQGLLIVMTNLDGFSLANHRQFTKLSRHTVLHHDRYTGNMALNVIIGNY